MTRYQLVDKDLFSRWFDTPQEAVDAAKQLEEEFGIPPRVFEFQEGQDVSDVEIYQSGSYEQQ